MLAILRAWAMALVLLTLIYWLLRVYLRSLRRERLERETEAMADPALREATIADAMRDYDRGLLPRLLWLVYILPLAAIAAIIYFVNYD